MYYVYIDSEYTSSLGRRLDISSIMNVNTNVNM